MVPPAADLAPERPRDGETPDGDHPDRHGRDPAALRPAVQSQRLYGLQGRHDGHVPAPGQLCGRDRRVYRARAAAAGRRVHLQAEIHQRRHPGPAASPGHTERGHRGHLSRSTVFPLRDHCRAPGVSGKAVPDAGCSGRHADLPRAPCELAVLEPPRAERGAYGGRDDASVYSGGTQSLHGRRDQPKTRGSLPIRRFRLAEGTGHPHPVSEASGGAAQGALPVPCLRRGIPDELRGDKASLRRLREELDDVRAGRAFRRPGRDGVFAYSRLVRVGTGQCPARSGGREILLG